MRGSLLLLALLNSPTATAEEALSAEALPEGFFEFLSLVVEQDGELIDPLSLDGPEQALDPAAASTDGVDSDAKITDADRNAAKQTEEHR